MQGKIVSWTLKAYYGFVEVPNSKTHIFLPGKSVLLPPGETVRVGDTVEFDIAPDRRHPDKPPIAVNVKVLARATDGVDGAQGAREALAQRYMRSDMQAMTGSRHRQAAEALFTRSEDVFRDD